MLAEKVMEKANMNTRFCIDICLAVYTFVREAVVWITAILHKTFPKNKHDDDKQSNNSLLSMLLYILPIAYVTIIDKTGEETSIPLFSCRFSISLSLVGSVQNLKQ